MLNLRGYEILLEECGGGYVVNIMPLIPFLAV
jgi:hypothetical protein